MAGDEDPRADSVADDLSAAWDAAEAESPGDVEGVEAEAPAASADGRTRDELGRFAATKSPAEEPLEPGDRSAGSAAPSDIQSPQAVQPAQPTHPQAGAQPQFAPPPGWSIAAKQEWDRLPEHVRAAVAEREVQVNQGFQKLQEYRGLEPFSEIARQNNTTLPQALERYIAAEDFLTRDPINGIRELCRMYGVHPAQVAGIAASGDDAEGGYQTPQQPQIDPMVYQLANEINALKSAVASREQGEVQSVLSQFAADPKHRYFENVRQVMGVLMQTGQASDLEAAYETACWANPQIRQALINEHADARRQSSEQAARNAASKARSAGRSIAGAPNGSVPNAPDRTLREELEAAWPE